jgi:hypothetical protein
MAIVYRHRRLDNNEIFYVGIGKEEKRAFSKSKRNIIWHNVTNKSGYEVEIIAKDLSWDDAGELEIFLISLYGKKIDNTGVLVNITGGGGGTLGCNKRGTNNGMYGKKHSNETKEKLRKVQLGRKHSKEVNLSKGIKDGDHSSARKVINTMTNEIFDCVKFAAKEYNLNYSTLISKLNGRRKNNTKLKYI